MTLQEEKNRLIALYFRIAEAEHANLFADALLEEVAKLYDYGSADFLCKAGDVASAIRSGKGK